MSMEQLAYLAEVLGVLGIVASLIYVGRQLQQTTLQMKVGAASERLQLFNQFWFRIAHDREFAELWLKGHAQYSTLDEVDQLRVQSFESAGLSTWSFFFELHEAEVLAESQWSEQVRDFEMIGRREAMREAWKSNKSRYSGPFQNLMAKYIEQSD